MTQTLTTEQANAYADRGTRDTWPALDEQATYTINLGTTYKTEILAAGLAEALLADMLEKQKQCSSIFGARREAEVDSQLATSGESAAMSAAKAYLYKMDQVLPIATRGVKLDDLKPEHLFRPKDSSKSTSKTKARLEAMRPLVVRLEDKLKRYFSEQSPVKVLDAVIANIQAAQANQASRQQARSPETFKLRVAKGELLEMIEDVNRLGRVAFMGQADIAGKFNKDILLKARRAGKHRQASAARESDGKGATATTPTPA